MASTAPSSSMQAQKESVVHNRSEALNGNDHTLNRNSTTSPSTMT